MSYSRQNRDNQIQLTDLPRDMLRIIEGYVPADQPKAILNLSCANKLCGTLFKPELTIRKALALAADAIEAAVPKLLQMVRQNPALLLQRGNTITRGGIEVENVTIYEFLLGEGDPDFAGQVGLMFTELRDGEAERIKQYNKYKPFIDGMLEPTPYDLGKLVETIQQASAVNMQAALKKEITDSTLEKALTAFRQAVTVKKITQPQMHYHYATLIHAFDLYDTEWNNLYHTSGDNHNKLDLVWRQVIGYLQRGLPAVDRFAFAKGAYDLVKNIWPLDRSTYY